MKTLPSLPLLAVLALLALPAATHAQWLATPVNDQFNNPNNWTGTTLPAAGSTAQFTINSNITNITVDTGRQAGLNITATTSAFVFTGGSFQLASGGGITTTSTVTSDQTVNSNLIVGSRNSASTAFLSAGATNGSRLIINGGFNGGQNVAGLSGYLSLRGGAGGIGVMNGVISDGTFGGNTIVQKINAGNWQLNGANTYTGGTELASSSGIIIAGNKAAFGTGQIRIAGGTSLEANTDLTGSNAIANLINYVSTAGATTTSNASITFALGSNIGTLVSGTAPAVGDLIPTSTTGSNFMPAFTRITGVSGSTITFSSNAIASGTTAATFRSDTLPNSGTGTTNISGTNNVEFSGTQNLTSQWSNGGAATQTFNVTNTGTTTFSGVLQQLGGVASIVKTGAGTLILSGANTYSGNTTFNGGTVLFNNTSGSASGTSGLVSVNSTATLGGRGFTSSLIAINSGASLRPGATAGESTALLTSTNAGFSALVLATGSTSFFDINGTSRGSEIGGYDAFDTLGRVGYGGAFTADFGQAAPVGTTVYDLFGFTATGGDFSSFAITGAYNVALGLMGTGLTGIWSGASGDTSFSFAQATGDLTVTVVPEPGVWGLMAGTMLLVATRRRTRRAI